MNFLKKYSKLSRVSYTSIRTFAYNAKPSNAPIGSGTRNTFSPSETTNSGIGIRSASIPGGSSRNPEHITSTDTRFNSFNASGPTSGFQASDSQDLGSSTKSFVDSTASSLKNLADEAANTAKGFVDQAQGRPSYGNERDNSVNRNRSRSPIDDLVDSANSVAQGVGSLAQGAVSAATSFGSNFVPQDSRSQQSFSNQSQRPAYYDQHDYNRDMAFRETGRYGSQDSRYTSYDPTQDIGKFVDSTARNIQDATNQAANQARDTFNQVTGSTFNTSQANSSNASNSDMIGSTFSQAQAIAGTAANIAGYAVKGMMDNVAYFASAFAPSSNSGTSTNSSSPRTTTSHTERSAAFNSQQTNNYASLYNPGFTSTENKRVEHMVSTDTRYNAFSSAGHVSGFGAPFVRKSTASEYNSDVTRFAGNAVSNIKGAVDQAADTAKDFIDRGSGYMNGTGNPAVDVMNQAAAIAEQTAMMIGSTLNEFVNVASSVANSMNPSQTQNRDMYGRRDQNYMNNSNNYGERRPQNFTSTDTRSNFFNPGQGSGSHPINPFDNPVGSFVSAFTQGNPVASMIQGAVNTGFNLASNFVPGSQSQNPNFFRQNQYSSSEDRSNRNPAAEVVDSAMKGAADVAQGLANAANNIASTFIPGTGGQSRNPSGQR